MQTSEVIGGWWEVAMFYRLVYCSRSRLGGSDPEVQASIKSILAASRYSNEKVGITGALIFNGHGFAQVLEGPRHAVEETYAKILADPRHDSVLLLEQAYQPERHFTDWFMAYSEAEMLRSYTGEAIYLNTVFGNPGFGRKLIELLRGSVGAPAKQSTS
jgi:hypothetical protein